MNLHSMKSDVLLMPGNADMFDNRPWLFNRHILQDFQHTSIHDIQTADSFTSPNYMQMQDEISFEHFVPPTDQVASSSSATASPDISLTQRHGSSLISKKEKSRKMQSLKQSPGSEEDSPENKSRRRREQNRIAQRTFRERKDRYIQSLEAHIKMLDASHKNLQESYIQSTDQINALYTQLIEAQGELDYWRCLAQPPSATMATTASIMHHLHSPSSEETTPVMNPNLHATDPARNHGHIIPVADMHMQHGHFT